MKKRNLNYRQETAITKVGFGNLGWQWYHDVVGKKKKIELHEWSEIMKKREKQKQREFR